MINLCRCLIHIRMRNCTICARLLSNHYSKTTKHPTAGLIVIGDEILKAQVKDTNSYYMCNLLYKCGIKVKKISVIGDNVEEISEEIKNAINKYTYVITSGGIGPTHDDVTYESLAKAFDDTLHYHPKLVDIIKSYFGIKDSSSPAFKMAYIPRKASLKFGVDINTGKTNSYPCVVLENVYVFPGSPMFFEKSFQSLYKDLLSTKRKFVKDEVFINTREEIFANALSMVAKEFPNVSFGSYPVTNCRYFKAFVTIESDNEHDTERAKLRFYELSPANIFVKYDRMPHVDCITKYNNFLQHCVHKSIYNQSLEEFRKLYQNPEHVSISIDGSIESSIVIHLAHIRNTQSQSNNKLQVVYFKEKQTSNDIEEFIKEMIDKYNLEVSTVEMARDKAINKLISMQPQLQTLLVGQIGKDHKKEINYDNNMNNVARLQIYCPLYNWTQEDIWSFATSLSLPYR